MFSRSGIAQTERKRNKQNDLAQINEPLATSKIDYFPQSAGCERGLGHRRLHADRGRCVAYDLAQRQPDVRGIHSDGIRAAVLRFGPSGGGDR